LQQAAPVLQHDTTSADLQVQSTLTIDVVGGTLPLPQHAAPAWQQVAPSVHHDTDDDFAPFIKGHLSPQHPPLPSFWTVMLHLPSVQQPSAQQDLPSAIFPSLPIGHLSEQHEQPLDLSAGAAGAAGLAACAIIDTANSSVTITTINFVFMISSRVSVARRKALRLSITATAHFAVAQRRSNPRSKS